MSQEAWKLAADVLEIIGLFLVAREVWRGHTMETKSDQLRFASQLLFLYTRKDYEGFLIACRLSQGSLPKVARQWADIFKDGQAPEALAKAVEAQWTELGNWAAAAIHDWENRVAPSEMMWRQIDLVGGTLLLIGAIVIRFANPIH